MSVVIAIDAGTTGVRVLRRCATTAPRPASRTASSPSTSRGPAGSSTTRSRSGPPCRRTLAELAGQLTEPIAAIGITDQRETVVAWDRRTGQPLHRAIVWQDRRTAGRCDALRAEGLEPLVRAHHRPRARPLLHRHQGGVAPHRGRRAGRRPTSRSARSTPGSSGTSPAGPTAGCSPPSRRTPAARCSSTSARLAWSDELLDRFGVPAAALPEVRPSSGRFGVTADGAGRGRRHPRVGHRRRPAGRPLRAGLPRAGHDQEHLRHRAASCSCTSATRCPEPVDGLLTTVGWTLADGTRAYALEGAIFVTARPCSGCATASASSSGAERDRGPRRHASPTPRAASSCPAFTGLGQPLVGPVRPGHDRRHHPRHRPGPPRPGRARVDQPPDARRRHRHERGLGSPDPRPQGRRRRRRQRPAAAAPGRRPPGAGVAARDPGDDRARAPPTSPAWPRACGPRPPTSRPTGASTPPSSPRRTTMPPPDARHAAWRRAVDRSRGWDT